MISILGQKKSSDFPNIRTK